LFIPADVPYEVEYSVSESIVANLLSCNYSEAELLAFENPAEGAMLFLQLLENWQTEHSVNQAKSSIYGILEKIDRGKRAVGENTAFVASLRYVEAHFRDPLLDICDVCDACFVSRSSLQREFSEHFGISPKQYIIKLRMNLALRLLVEARLPVREIALSCGFLDEKYFSRAFKKQYGCSPSEMRKRISV
jgi:AraC-like DNA-binding protein